MTDAQATADPDVFAAWGDYNADVSCDERYRTYHGYVESSYENYEHLVRKARPEVHPDGLQAGIDEIADIQFWLDKLAGEYERLFPMCGACGQRHHDPRECDLHPDKELKTTHVTIDITVWESDDPTQTVRDWIAASAIPENVYIDDPE